MAEKIISKSVEETRAAGARLATTARPGDVFALVGDLGTGKTEFARGFVEALCGPAAVRSPTFSIVNIHESSKFPVYHFDFYRLRNKDELEEIGFYEYVRSDGVVLVEWADMFPDALPEHAVKIRFSDQETGVRLVEIG